MKNTNQKTKPICYRFLVSIVLLYLPFSFCFSQDVLLYSQADVDAFDPSITTISGDLTILSIPTSDPITNINNLANLTTIGGRLVISHNEALSQIDGLSNLTTIGGGLLIYNNNALLHLDGLSNLTTIGDYLDINYSDALFQIDGLSNVTSIGGYLRIKNSGVLSQIDALNNLTSVNGLLFIEYTALSQIDGLSNLTSVSGHLYIGYNAALTQIDGLSNLTSIGLDLLLNNNIALTDCCAIQDLLSTPGAIGGTIEIYDNPSECSSEVEIVAAACETTATNDLDMDGTKLSIHPNPSQHIFNISFDNVELANSIDQCQIVNAFGQQVYSKKIGALLNNSLQIDLSKQADGIYFYSFFDKNNRLMASGKLIKQ